MRYNLSQLGYYADQALAPLLACFMTAYAYDFGATQLVFCSAALFGFLAWQVVEWVMHKYLFHRVMKREHWMHHQRPEAYIGAQPWQSMGAHLAFGLAAIWLLGDAIGPGLSAGLLLGYTLYIVAHDAIHHDPLIMYDWSGSVFHNAWKRHMLHHRGVEANYCVALPYADMVFGTYVKV